MISNWDFVAALKNPRHEQFAQLVCSGKSATESYVLAGFSPNGAAQGAAKLLRHKQVSERISDLSLAVSNAASTRAEIDRHWVLEGLKKNFSRAMQEESALDKEGKPTGEFAYNGSVANRSLELLGKAIGMFGDVPAPNENRKQLVPEWLLQHLKDAGSMSQTPPRSDSTATSPTGSRDSADQSVPGSRLH